jgi:hypothetical protein
MMAEKRKVISLRARIKELGAELTIRRARWRDLLDMHRKFDEEYKLAFRLKRQATIGIAEVSDIISRLQKQRKKLKSGK